MKYYSLYFILFTFYVVHAYSIQQTVEIKQIPLDRSYSALDELDRQYSAMINQVFDSNMNELYEGVPDTLYTIHELQSIGKDYCQTLLLELVDLLETELEATRNQLLISVRPLLETTGTFSASLDPLQITGRIIDTLYPTQMTTLHKMFRMFQSSRFRLRTYHEHKEAAALSSWLTSWLMDIQFTLNQAL